jgi:predicted DNA-binding transcriptional regulator AlpA
VGVSSTTIYCWNSSGDGPRLKNLGNPVRYAYGEVVPWLAR